MNKKGLQFVDWAISAGLFIIYLVILFILMAPAFTEDYSPEYLGSIVEAGIEGNLSIELIRFPAFMRLEESPWPAIVGASRPYRFYLNNLPKEFDTLIPEKQIIIYNNKTQELVKKDIDLIGDRIVFAAYQPQIGIDSPPPTERASVTLDIFFSDYEIFNDSPLGSAIPWPGTQESTIGVGESVKGIFEEKFNNFFAGKEYTEVKEDFHFPLERDFTIEVFNGTDLSAPARLAYNQTLPDEKDTVNTLVWAGWIIDNTTQRTGVTILVKVW
jgi:hypothetical protein